MAGLQLKEIVYLVGEPGTSSNRGRGGEENDEKRRLKREKEALRPIRVYFVCYMLFSQSNSVDVGSY